MNQRRSEPCLRGRGLWKGRLLVFDSLPSTNRWAMSHLDRCRHGDVLRAVRQTAGVGRFARSWASPADRGLAVSVLLRESGIGPPAGWIGQTGAVAVHSTLRGFGIDGKLKWPNDVVVGAKKISGILCERDAKSGTIVLGIGTNVNVTAEDLLAARLAATATSMLIETGSRFAVGTVCRRLVRELQAALDRLVAEGAGFVLRTWADHDWLAGSVVEVDGPAGAVRGGYDGLDDSGRLLLRDEAGLLRAMWSGDVRRVSKQ